nr:50.8 kDa Serine/threonine protein kinase [Scenedesmaceae sp. YH-2023b]
MCSLLMNLCVFSATQTWNPLGFT